MDLNKAVTAMLVIALVITGSLAAYSMSRGGETRTMTVTVGGKPGTGVSVLPGDKVASFSSYEQLARYLEASRIVGSVSQAAGLPFVRLDYTVAETGAVVPLTAKGRQSAGAAAPGYSKTNVQVEGIDEADIVKTDGTRIYVASGSRVWVLRAYPPSELRVEGEVSLGKDARARGLFVAGDKLVVLVEKGLKVVPLIRAGASVVRAELNYGYPSTIIQVYSVPGLQLLYNVSLSGGYVTSRLINTTLYVVASQPVMSVNSSLSIPSVDGEPLPPGSVYYFPEQMGMTYTLVLGMDLETGRHSARALLTSYTSRIYMTTENLYVVSSGYMNFTEIMVRVGKAISSINGSELDAWAALGIVAELERALGDARAYDKTAIYRFAVRDLDVVPEASTVLDGRILDQFSIDESDGYLRVAVTIGGWRSNLTNTLYVLRVDDLGVVGRLDGLAEGERIYAARFVGSLCFLVTYRQMDPLFAIDLSDPSSPQVVGFIEMPGYSEYLHPYADDLIIGVGLTDDHRVKIAVFNVSNPEAPVKLSEVITNYTYTPVLWDHKAFTINDEKGYMLIPVAWPRMVVKGEPAKATGGVLVLDIDASTGKLGIRGVLDHRDAIRGLYIGDTVYSVSYRLVKAFSYETMEEISEAHLGK